ncbi:SpoIIE family protein phosphatase [Streptomyces luteireticuli]|uniref:SpoIIE family protein phosphatase n=1 Tax=Streptomyces luteireticuli TaxID=173858 RepID=UPI003555E146
MGTTDAHRPGPGRAAGAPAESGGLLDLLSVAAVVLDREGRIVLWSPQAEKLFGWTPAEALDQYAARLLVSGEDMDVVLDLFSRVMGEGESWAGVFPVRHKDGRPRLVELRNVRLEDRHGAFFALGIATDHEVLHRVERDLALSMRLVAQSPIGLAVIDTDLRYVMVNPALERIHGLPAEEHIGRRVRDVLPYIDAETSERAMRRVLATGRPLLDRFISGGLGGAGDDRARLVSYYRLDDAGGHVLGLAASVIDVTDRHRADIAAAEARRRLALIADASVLIGTTLDLDQTARELAEVVVPDLADVAAVDILDTALEGNRAAPPDSRAVVIRALAVAAADTAGAADAARAADPPGEIAQYPADRLVTRCVTTGRPVHLPRVGTRDLPCIARDRTSAAVLARAGLHSYVAVPLIARGEVLGALDLKRTDNPVPFGEDDVILAGELAARAAVCIDNARWYQRERATVLSLQRTLLPQRPPNPVGLQVAYRYQPAGAASQVGGDWFDVVPQDGGRSALVVGDVMGSGITAAAVMGQLRTAARTLAGLGLDPARVLRHLDQAAIGLGQLIATCVYVVYDPEEGCCRAANAGHLPPVLIRDGEPPVLLELPTGAPLGVGDVPFESVVLELRPRDRLVLYTDGLVETRDESIDVRLAELLRVLGGARRGLEETCDLLLSTFRLGNDDDAALLIAEVS